MELETTGRAVKPWKENTLTILKSARKTRPRKTEGTKAKIE
jgi:hypothetical protein